MDALRAKAGAAEHRRRAAEYRATRIELDKELQARAEAAESSLSALREQIRGLVERYTADHKFYANQMAEWRVRLNQAGEPDAGPYYADGKAIVYAKAIAELAALLAETERTNGNSTP